MSGHIPKSIVVILGCVHANSETAPGYAGKLKELIVEIRPQVLCVELSPEQLHGEQGHGAKKEYADVILPLAGEFKIAVVPIDPPSSVAEPMIREKHRAEQELQEDHIGNIRMELMDKFTEIIVARWYAALDKGSCFEFVQARAFDVLHFEPWYAVHEEYFPAWSRAWDIWNEYLVGQIHDTIVDNAGKRILITIGLDHKYWFWNHLKDRDDIILHNLQSFRAARMDGGNSASPSD